MKRAIAGFYEDLAGDFVAMLECGHEQHVRHKPPLTLRPWVLTDVGRAATLGQVLECKACDPENEAVAGNEEGNENAET